MSEHSSNDDNYSSHLPSNDDPASGAVKTAGPALARTMGLGALIIYGIGDMLGSGVYALIGKAAGIMGNAVWLAFAASMVAALLTGLSYASLGSRYPRAAGASFITHRAFGLPFLSYMVGLAVAASGLTSFATQSRTFAGYLQACCTEKRVPPRKRRCFCGWALSWCSPYQFSGVCANRLAQHDLARRLKCWDWLSSLSLERATSVV
jgi:amino acid transporter